MVVKKPKIIFFDMDHTVISIDCDVSWKYFLSDEGLAPYSDRSKADHFLEIYHQGKTDVDEFVKFQLKEFIDRTPEKMRELAQRHFNKRVREKVYPKAYQEIRDYCQAGARVALLTGTNRIIAEPLAQCLAVSDLLATELEIQQGRFTGKVIEPFLMKEGKVKMANDYCSANKISLSQAAFYADSITDLPLLEKVGTAVIVNPRNNRLSALAQAHNWPIKHWTLDENHSGFANRSHT
jgi:HAD superfamily hydrolase (TIGR01490 family)